MEGIGTRLNVQLKDTTQRTTVPNNDVAKLMYYLKCVTKCCGMDILQDDLVDYGRYYRLSNTRKDSVFLAAFKYSPDVFQGKTLFFDEDIPENFNGKFFEVNAALDLVAVQSNVMVGGRMTQASKVFIAKRAWLEENYIEPMRRNISRVRRVIGDTSHRSSSSCCMV